MLNIILLSVVASYFMLGLTFFKIVMLSVNFLNVMLSVNFFNVMLSVNFLLLCWKLLLSLLNVAMLNAVMLIVVAPFQCYHSINKV
jgi:hypothetical protein